MTAPEQPERPLTMKFGDFKKFVDDRIQAAVQAVTGGDNPPSQPRQRPFREPAGQSAPRRSVDEEVSTALKKLEADKAREAKEAERDAKLSELEERTKERPPVERRRVHRVMGWGE